MFPKCIKSVTDCSCSGCAIAHVVGYFFLLLRFGFVPGSVCMEFVVFSECLFFRQYYSTAAV
jgi:hypothetical protein